MGKIAVSDYLIQELTKLGITEVFGLPGDYNFNIIKSIEKNTETTWVGCSNELNAGYSADGYARVRGYGAILTTFGVGELSAINAVAGSFAENIPVISIVGAPKTKFIENKSLIHHNFINPDYEAFHRAYKNVTAATAFLNKSNPKEEIDRVLSVFIREKKPVYIAIPEDVCLIEIENESKIQEAESNEFNLQEAAEHAFGLIERAASPVILGGILIKRSLAARSFQKFMEISKIPASTMMMGKGLIHEEGENSGTFMGTFLGHLQNEAVYRKINDSDCVISIGAVYSDFNTFGFDICFNPSDFIEIGVTNVIIENKIYEEVYMEDFLEVLTEKIRNKPLEKFEIIKNKPLNILPEYQGEKPLDFKYILPSLQSFLKPDDMLFFETGILTFGSAQLTLPKGAEIFAQFLWASIGWATPALFGAQIASNRRAILFTGEGSHQLTVQAVSDIMYRGLKPIIFVLNNSGYTIERILSDNPDDKYNEIPSWNYTKIPEVFQGSFWTAQALTNKELDKVLKQAEIEQKKRMCYIEIFTDKMNLPCLMAKYISRKKPWLTQDNC